MNTEMQLVAEDAAFTKVTHFVRAAPDSVGGFGDEVVVLGNSEFRNTQMVCPYTGAELIYNGGGY